MADDQVPPDDQDDQPTPRRRPGKNAKRKARLVRGESVPAAPIVAPLDPDADPETPVASRTKFRPTEFVVRDVLPRRQVIGLFGPPASGKSLFAEDTIARATVGTDILGRRLIGGPQNCLIFTFEDDGGTVKQRCIARGSKLDPAEHHHQR